MLHRLPSPSLLAALLAATLLATGCAGRGAPRTTPAPAVAPPGAAAEAREPTAPPEASAAAPDAPGAAAGAAAATAPDGTEPAAVPEPPRPSLRELCKGEVVPGAGLLLESKRRLEETFCGANLWFDGLFGGEPDVANARSVSGRVELSMLYTEVDGLSVKPRLRVSYDLPTLEKRLNLFIGRDDRDDFVQDRREGIGIRSSIFGLESDDKWLAGLGYSLPGRYQSKVDFRLGARVKSAPEVFAQARYRRNWFVGDSVVVRFRETGFWENREDGFGSTTSLDVDRVLQPNLLLRVNTVATVTQATHGAAWRSAALLYHSLERSRAFGYEIFVRGETSAPVQLREYGTRAVYRQPIGKEWLFGEFIVGYTWPRAEHDPRREGSAMVGLGVELFFGQEER